MIIRPITLKAANEYIKANHRHHGPVVGLKFAVSVVDSDGNLRGVAVAGRPVARMIDQELVLEVTRLCTDGYENACSKLYSSIWRAAKALGYQKCITYILASEPGTSLKACGWRYAGESGGGSWSRPSRGRADKHPTEPKHKYEIC